MTATMRSPIVRMLTRHVVSLMALLLVSAVPAAAQELLTNGNFESGLTGWTIDNEVGGAGNFFLAAPGATGPLSLNPTAANPSGGTQYLLSDQTGPGAHALRQTFTVPGPGSVLLQFQMFVNDWSSSGGIIGAQGLDFTGNPNQHARVDILTSAATAFDTGGGVLQNLYAGVDPNATNPNPYKSYFFDITPTVGAGGTFQIRFAEADNQLYLNQGVDNVSILFIPSVPMVTPWMLILLAGAILFLGARLITTRGRMHFA